MHVDGQFCDVEFEPCLACNRQRVDRATKILDLFDELAGPTGDPFDTAGDLLADLLHLMDTLNIDHQELIDRGESHYLAERTEEKQGKEE